MTIWIGVYQALKSFKTESQRHYRRDLKSGLRGREAQVFLPGLNGRRPGNPGEVKYAICNADAGPALLDRT